MIRHLLYGIVVLILLLASSVTLNRYILYAKLTCEFYMGNTGVDDHMHTYQTMRHSDAVFFIICIIINNVNVF